MRNRKIAGAFLLLTLIAAMSVAVTSCSRFIKDNRGYPKQISFTPQGGEQTISGDDSFSSFEIQTNKGSIVSEGYDFVEPDSMIVSYKWLTIKKKFFANETQVYAAPNKSKKPRELKICGFFGDLYYAMIHVRQEGNR